MVKYAWLSKPRKQLWLNFVPSWSLWKVNAGSRQCQKESLLIMVNLILIKTAGVYCSVSRPHDKFNRWTKTLIFICSQKDLIFPSKIFLVYNIILVSKLDTIVSIERKWVFNFVDEHLQGDIRPGQPFVSSPCAVTSQCFLRRHRLSVKTETKLCCLTGCPRFLTPALTSVGFYIFLWL